MSDFDRDEESLARALKRAADAGGRGIVPEPAERVAARGLRRRRRTMAALAACAVCLLAGSGAALGLRLQQSPPVLPASTPDAGTPSPARDTGTPSERPSPSYPTPPPTATATPSPPFGSPPPSPSFSLPDDSGSVTPTARPR
ncbi:hypothetical protein [Streptomyces sp. HUAS TT7]|uniref:hypothetical protein n=1 Tax=Streptomyces sp. HUAS TT7 TaxID=3447507 RepID=UPI003F658B66